jgi:hypothetical protein
MKNMNLTILSIDIIIMTIVIITTTKLAINFPIKQLLGVFCKIILRKGGEIYEKGILSKVP